MERVKIRNSSNISEAGYDAAAEVLEIKFTDGQICHFFGVPQHVASGFFNPPWGSPGQYFSAKISRFYQHIRL